MSENAVLIGRFSQRTGYFASKTHAKIYLIIHTPGLRAENARELQ